MSTSTVVLIRVGLHWKSIINMTDAYNRDQHLADSDPAT